MLTMPPRLVMAAHGFPALLLAQVYVVPEADTPAQRHRDRRLHPVTARSTFAPLREALLLREVPVVHAPGFPGEREAQLGTASSGSCP